MLRNRSMPADIWIIYTLKCIINFIRILVNQNFRSENERRWKRLMYSTKWFFLVDGNKAVFGQELSYLSVSQEGLSQKWVFAMETLEAEGGSMLLFLFIAPSAHLKPLNVLLNFSAFEAVGKPNYRQRENCIKLSGEMTEPLQCSLICVLTSQEQCLSNPHPTLPSPV